MIRVLIADDHPIFRRGVVGLIEGTEGMRVVAEADDGIAAMRLAKELEWDVALIDVSMPTLNGVEVLRRLVKAYPARRVLILSQFPEDQFAARVMREGAAGYIAKSAPPEQLLDAIRGRGPTRAAAQVKRDPLPHERLTPREYQVFTLIAGGRTVTEAAAEINVAVSTVSNHLLNIKEKLNAPSVGAVVAYAHRMGLIE